MCPRVKIRLRTYYIGFRTLNPSNMAPKAACEIQSKRVEDKPGKFRYWNFFSTVGSS